MNTINPIKLVNNTISNSEMELLIEWLKTSPQLTKGNLTIQFESKFANYINTKYAIFVNSGSSANLAIIYALIASKRLKNKKIIVPAVSWVTTVSPVIHLGLEPILCDCDTNNLGLDTIHLENLFKAHRPSAVILVHVLGIPNQLDRVVSLCKQYDVILIEDTCESLGSTYQNKKLGSFGLMSSFSMYYSHHMSTIEGGMICIDDMDMYHTLLSIRCHGWDRDLPVDIQVDKRKKYNIDSFKALYTFYYPGFNLRSTDLQAFIGINQLERLQKINLIRNENFNLYNKYISNLFWKIIPPKESYVSNFAYPLISEYIKTITKNLSIDNIESRPLVCGSIGRQPFWIDLYGEQDLPNADAVHDYGFYIPNNPDMTEKDIIMISEIINNSCYHV